jgi:hypothetical protein
MSYNIADAFEDHQLFGKPLSRSQNCVIEMVRFGNLEKYNINCSRPKLSLDSSRAEALTELLHGYYRHAVGQDGGRSIRGTSTPACEYCYEASQVNKGMVPNPPEFGFPSTKVVLEDVFTVCAAAPRESN